jgi:hypothetical protein
VYGVHFISETVSPKEDKYKPLPFSQVAAVSIETGNI